MSLGSDTPGPESPPPPRRRPLLPAALLVATVACFAILAWWGWRWYSAPRPPEVALAGADPALSEAIEAARQKVLEEPYSADAWGHLGKLLRAADFHTEAAVCFEQAERLDPASPRWPYLCGEARQQTEPEAALPHLRRAADLAGPGDPRDLAAWLRLGELLLAKRQHDEAESYFRRALEAAPDTPSAHLNLGFLAHERGDLEASRRYLLRCQDSPFTRQKACARLAEVYLALGDTEGGARFGRRAATLPPDLHWIDPYVAECLQAGVGRPNRFQRVEQLEAQGRLKEAVALLSEEIRQSPDVRAYVGLGNDLARLGDYVGAEEALRAAIQIDPDEVQAHYYLAKVLWAEAEQAHQKGGTDDRVQKQFGRAAESARQAIARKPDHALAHMILGLSLRRLGRRADGLAELRSAVQHGPDLADPFLHLGEALAEDGHRDEARFNLEQAARLARPDDLRAQEALARLSGKRGDRPPR